MKRFSLNHNDVSRQGFTLIELSIVIAILGLLVGGVLVGQSLIRASELRSIAVEYQRYVTAAQNFKAKYQALPGDLMDATYYWGAADGGNGNSAGCQSTLSTGTTATCNGDGNGVIDNPTSSMEPFRFWQHLANAGYISGSFSGVGGVSSMWPATTPANAPTGRIRGSQWFVYSWYTQTGAFPELFDGQYGNSLEFGGPSPSGKDPTGANLKPEEALNIDTKMDDGMPATGKVVARVDPTRTLADCTTTSSHATLTAQYLVSSTAIGCSLLFPQVF